MHTKTLRAMFMGHEIVACNVWGPREGDFVSEAALAIDGAVVARTNEWSARKAVLRANLIDRERTHDVEVRFGGIFTVRMKILVDGKKIAGDLR